MFKLADKQADKQASRPPLPKPWQEELMGKAGAQKAAAVEAKKTCSK